MKIIAAMLEESDRRRACFLRIDSTIGEDTGASSIQDKGTGFLAGMPAN